jgi:hypothetical protein
MEEHHDQLLVINHQEIGVTHFQTHPLCCHTWGKFKVWYAILTGIQYDC